jgi:hypothetical protein
MGGHAVLRSERQPAEARLHLVKEWRIERCEDNESPLRVEHAGGTKQLGEPTGAEQHGVLVERAAPDDLLRERIERIVLDDDDEASRPDHASRFDEEGLPIIGRNVMHDSDRIGDVEAAIIVGKPRAFIDIVMDVRIAGFGFFDDGTGDVDSGQLDAGRNE